MKIKLFNREDSVVKLMKERDDALRERDVINDRLYQVTAELRRELEGVREKLDNILKSL